MDSKSTIIGEDKRAHTQSEIPDEYPQGCQTYVASQDNLDVYIYCKKIESLVDCILNLIFFHTNFFLKHDFKNVKFLTTYFFFLGGGKRNVTK